MEEYLRKHGRTHRIQSASRMSTVDQMFPTLVFVANTVACRIFSDNPRIRPYFHLKYTMTQMVVNYTLILIKCSYK